MKKLKFHFHIDGDLMEGVERLAPVLGYEMGGGITVFAEKSDRTGLSLSGGKATVYYTEKHLFFRQLGILAEHAGEEHFEAFEDGFFQNISVMLDASRCAVPTVKTMFKMLDYLAIMGYGMAMLYTEDTVELPDRPYFGYMRGRYSHSELKEIDDYAFAYGIELIPCLECYGHMDKYLMWSEADEIRDTARVLLAREEATFRFLDTYIGTVSSCFRSRRIHVGMDEANDMGRGRFLDKHGYVPPLQIFNEYMDRLIEITDKYGLTPMMWSDMYFRTSNQNNLFYGEDIEISPETAAAIPKNMELVFWHYGEEPGCDNYMLEKHKRLNRHIIYASGLWNWCGHFPENNYAMKAMREGLVACRRNGVRETMMTLWGTDNAECDWFASLLGLSCFAEISYDKDASTEKIKARFEAVSGGSYDIFMAMSAYHNKFDGGEEYENYHDRFFGKPLFWQDVLGGLYDRNLMDSPMSAHYAKYAQVMKDVPTDRWSYLYDFANKVFDYLATKTLIAEQVSVAANEDDKETLKQISNVLFPRLIEKTKEIRLAHRDIWLSHNKPEGWGALDIRYAGVVARCETGSLLIDRYLGGDPSAIDELKQTRLTKPLNGFIEYPAISTVNGNV